MRKLPTIETLVIKIGSSIISGNDLGLNNERIAAIANEISALKKQIPNIIIVSSGAVAAGFKLLGFETRPKDIVDKQASAAVGQARLIWKYEQDFAKHGINVAQVLLTKDDLSNRKRYLNARSALKRLLELKVIPIINENDTILVDELKYIETFGDNDNLGALVASLVDADMMLIMSDVDGLYTKDPTKHDDAKLINNVDYIDDSILNSAGKSISNVGTGGMASKIQAAKKALDVGCEVAIIKGMVPENISKFFTGELIGTHFSHKDSGINRRKFWIGHAAIPKGFIIIDNGAEKALCNHKSLLAKGIVAVEGKFTAGEVVSVMTENRVEIARGKIRYSSTETQKILKKNSSEIFDILGYKVSDEVIHIDDIYLLV